MNSLYNYLKSFICTNNNKNINQDIIKPNEVKQKTNNSNNMDLLNYNYNKPHEIKLQINDKNDKSMYKIINCLGKNCNNILFLDNMKVSLCNKCLHNLI